MTYLSNNDFGPLSAQGTRVLLDNGYLHTPDEGDLDEVPNPIHWDPYRSPEEVIGYPWSYGIEIWNLGIHVSPASSFDPIKLSISDQRTSIPDGIRHWSFSRAPPYSSRTWARTKNTTLTSTSP